MNNIFVTANVVGCIVKPHDLVLIDAPIVEEDGIPVEVDIIVR
jgi:hypothetical protein